MKKATLLLLLLIPIITFSQSTVTDNNDIGDIGQGSSENGWVLSDIKSEFKVDLKIDYAGSSQNGTLEKIYSLQGGGNITFNIDGYQYNNKLYNRNDINKIVGYTVIGAIGGVKYKVAFSNFFDPIEKTSLDGRKTPGFILESKIFSEQPNYESLKFAYTKIIQRRSVEFENQIKQYFTKKDLENKAVKNNDEISENDNLNTSSVNNDNEINTKTTSNSNQNSSNANSESIYDKQQREKREKESKKQKNYNEGIENLDRIEESAKRLDASIKESDDKLKDYYETTFNSWTKQRDFNNTISTLTRIDNTSINSIIAEVKQKSSAIDNQYAQQSEDTKRAIAENGQKNKSNIDANTNNAITGAAQVIAGISNENQRRKAQQKLKEEQDTAITKLVKKFEEKIKPRREQYFQLAKFAVFPDEEIYYVGLFKYNHCLIENAYSILKGNNKCIEPKMEKPTKRKNISAKNYFDAGMRKAKSKNESVILAVPKFFELAIEADPTNAIMLYGLTLVKNFNIYENAAILEKAHELDKGKTKEITEDYNKAIKTLEDYEESRKLFIYDYIDENSDYDWEAHSNLMRIKIIGNHKEHIFVDKSGKIIFNTGKDYDFGDINLEPEIEQQFNNGLIKVLSWVRKKDKIGNETTNYWVAFLNEKLEVKIPFKYEEASRFSEGLAAVQDPETRKWGYINTEDKIELPFQYAAAGLFSDHLAFVEIITSEGQHSIVGDLKNPETDAVYIDSKGKRVIEGDFDKGKLFVNGLAVVVNWGGGSFMGGTNATYWYIDKNGENVFKENFKIAHTFNRQGYALVRKKNKFFYINTNGKNETGLTFFPVPDNNKEIFFHNGKAKVNVGSKYRNIKYVFINETGKIVKEK